MTLLSFPDINVWLAVAAPEHPYHSLARKWWKGETNQIAFPRFSQLGFLRLVTTPAVMDDKPLSITQAWAVYDRFYEDARVVFVAEPSDAEGRFRERATGPFNTSMGGFTLMA